MTIYEYTTLSPEASAVQSAIQRIDEFCKEWDANIRILSDPAIDPNTGKFHIAVKVGELVMLNSPSPVDAKEILTLTSCGKRCFIGRANALNAPLRDLFTLVGRPRVS